MDPGNLLLDTKALPRSFRKCDNHAFQAVPIFLRPNPALRVESVGIREQLGVHMNKKDGLANHDL